MKNHPGVEAADRCAGCAEPFCNDCLVEIGGQKYCGSCKVIAVKGKPVIEAATQPCKEAGSALIYAIIGIFCFGIILEPVAFITAVKAKKRIRENPNLTGSGKAAAAQVIAVSVFILGILGIVVNISQR